jgi:hypothetical protein
LEPISAWSIGLPEGWQCGFTQWCEPLELSSF